MVQTFLTEVNTERKLDMLKMQSAKTKNEKISLFTNSFLGCSQY